MLRFIHVIVGVNGVEPKTEKVLPPSKGSTFDRLVLILSGDIGREWCGRIAGFAQSSVELLGERVVSGSKATMALVIRY